MSMFLALSMQLFVSIGLLCFALILAVWLYKTVFKESGENTDANPKMPKGEDNPNFPKRTADVDDIVEKHQVPVKNIKGKTSIIQDKINNDDSDVEEHVNEIDKYLNATEQHIAGYIDQDLQKDAEFPLGKDNVELTDEEIQLFKKSSHSEAIIKNRPTILIVDDNLALRKYLMSILRGSYNILQEENGEDGLETARNSIPDVIISDIMMPIMDGIKFCTEVRNDPSIEYLPFIMLTSKIGDLEMLKGLRSGADAYLQKPFNANVLLETVKNTLSSRKKLLSKLQKEDSEKYTLPVSSKDDFIKTLDQTINSHIDDHNLKINDLAKELNISQRQFQRKVKELSGTTPKKYLRSHRLKIAKHLLKNDSSSITEVAYAVGFNNLSLFSSYFKAEFNVLPSTLKSTNKDA
ncbi:MAG: helix-turn-helix domain-containing protein [Balneolaceae bacterium]